MNVFVFSNQPLVSKIILEISKKVNTNVTQTFCSSTIKLNHHLGPFDLVIIVESKTTPIHSDILKKIKTKTNKVVLVKNPFSKLNVRQLYVQGSNNIISTEDSQSVFEQSLMAAEECKPYLSSCILSEMGMTYPIETNKLSPDEITIIKMSWAEKRNKEIADSLCLSIRTIENKRIRIKEKFAVESFTGVFKKAIVDGLIAI